MAIKVPVRAATTAHLAALSGLLVVDGVQLVQDDRVLVKNQNAGADNGIYVADSGEWARAPDFDGPFDVTEGTLIPVMHGTVNGASFYQVTNIGTITIDTTALTFAQAYIVNASTTLQIVSTIAALKAVAAPSTPATYLVRGYAAAGDGGGGFYYWNSVDVTADNGGTVIALNAGGVGRFNKLF